MSQAREYGGGQSTKSQNKQAACLQCRRMKMKCHRSLDATICTRCSRTQSECVIPDYHVGRHKGVKNKRSGLEKAMFQIEEALKKSETSAQNDENLQRLLRHSQTVLPQAKLGTYSHATSTQQMPSSPISNTTVDVIRTESSQLADAENPLQLLAQTSEMIREASETGRVEGSEHSAASTTLPRGAQNNDLHFFFGPIKVHLDTDAELDPVSLGLLTLNEADELFDYFFSNLAHTRWGIDPMLHTPLFVRSRSLFLFTSICAASSLFQVNTEALSLRLSNHCRRLVTQISPKRYRSVEIVLALMLAVPWLSAGEHWAEDETSTYLSMALNMAIDLSLDKIIRPSPSSHTVHDWTTVSSRDCIQAIRALELDGFGNIDPSSIFGRQLLRRRERTWLALFVLERGVCLARGRRYTLPMSPLIETCDQWHVSDISDTWDGSIVSVAVLRRELAGLVEQVESICDRSRTDRAGPDLDTVQTIKGQIEAFFDQWYTTWPVQIADRKEYNLPPYVEILASHTRLSLYSSVINHPTASVGVRHFFRAAGLSSALTVMRAAVQGEGRLKSMPNNTAIMISFAACFALRLSTLADGSKEGLAPSVRNLIEETADVLERIGSTPSHRKGLSALFAKQLRHIVASTRRPSSPKPPSRQHTGQLNSPSASVQHAYLQIPQFSDYDAGQDGAAFVPPAPFMFSGMSNEEIDEVINSAGQVLDMPLASFDFTGGTGLNWLEWPA